MEFKGKRIGVAICASCCTYHKVKDYIKQLMTFGAEITVIISHHAQEFDTRFGRGQDLVNELEELTGNQVLKTIVDVEPIGPKGLLDLLVIAPCTGNTLAKLANAITDTSVVMAGKSMLRNERPVVISLSTNDALGLNMKNIGILMNTKNVYFVPIGQDNPTKKPNSMSADLELVIPTIESALEGKQLQPVIIQY